MSEIDDSYKFGKLPETSALPTPDTYWRKVAEQERKKAADNLRLAAERASVIAELRKELEEAKAKIKQLETEREAARAFLKPLTECNGEDFESLEGQVKQTFMEWRKEMQAIIGDSLDDFDLDEFLKERHG